MSNQNNGVTLGNILAIIGFVIFGVFTYFGQMFLTEGEMASSILWSAGFTALLVLFYVLAIVAKAKEEFPKAWRAVECCAVAFYLLCAALTFKGVVHFFSIMSNKEKLVRAGEDDAKAIREMFNSYEDEERTAVAQCQTGLKSLVGYNGYNEEVRAALSKHGLGFMLTTTNEEETYKGIDVYCRKQSETLYTGSDYKGTKEKYLSLIDEFESDIKGWKVFSLPGISREMENCAGELAKWMTDRSATKSHLPVVHAGSGHFYVQKENQQLTFSAPELTFGEEISGFRHYSLLAYLGLVLIHTLIVLSYLLAPRSLIIMPKAKSNGQSFSGGQVLG